MKKMQIKKKIISDILNGFISSYTVFGLKLGIFNYCLDTF